MMETNEFGEKKGVIKPFIIDLDSTNGTHVNDEQIPPARYYELKLNDSIKFGTSSREFVLLHESCQVRVTPRKSSGRKIAGESGATWFGAPPATSALGQGGFQ
jgi:pSer/pThr/pTyr-binding forkhead associated (FHA) protein